MNKLNKELLERALAEGVDESFDGSVLSLAVGNRLWNGFHITAPMGQLNSWQYVCTKEEYLAAKAEKETMSDTKNEYDVGCYYEFSDYADFRVLNCETFSSIIMKAPYPYYSNKAAYKYIRPLAAKAGEIRKPKPLSGFVNVYKGFNTKEEADRYAGSARIACIDLSQFNEGEGLN